MHSYVYGIYLNLNSGYIAGKIPKAIRPIKTIAPKTEAPAKPITNIKRAEKLFSLKEIFAVII